ncbi:MAG: 2OG-Fe(II) oxygenase [Kordiimonadaceae bacterium]|nr:2OG-Fe(II) oxygenase [Kordiimonadaceae bacterium]MBT6032220.1 2OG-Fe(II) oxygenase [Kordiimonadaceae bacterium]
MDLKDVINLSLFPLSDIVFQKECKRNVDENGALVLKGFILPSALEKVRQEGLDNQDKAYYCAQDHNVYLTDPDLDYPMNHPRNRLIKSTKGCITDDQIPLNSPLHVIYDSEIFHDFLCNVLGEEKLYDYADSLSSINLHYASEGKELGWHFDNSSFATTLLIQKPDGGGVFEYVENMRDADKGEMNFDGVKKVLDGKVQVKTMSMPEGTLVLFRGRNALHRVTPTQGDTTRMLVVLAYNSEPNVAISDSASMTFYGRIG